MDQKIEQAVNAAIEAGTFSLQAVEGIKLLRAEHAALASILKQAQEYGVEQQWKVQEANRRIGELLTQLKEWENHQEILRVREETAHKKEIDQAADRARADAYNNAFNTVFRNTVMRETMNHSISSSGPNGYSNHTETTTKERTQDSGS